MRHNLVRLQIIRNKITEIYLFFRRYKLEPLYIIEATVTDGKSK
jgi:hypothetical protein